MTSEPKRRWFSFSLRTMFVVVTLFGCWLGNELHRVRDRRAMAKEIERMGGEVRIFPFATHPRLSVLESARVLAFGDLPTYWIIVPDQKFTEADIARVRCMFPNAKVDHYPGVPRRKIN